MNRGPSTIWLLTTVLIGWVALILPLPTGLDHARPYLLALVLAYWVLEAPDRVGLGVCFLTGLVADVVSGTLLGEQALRLVVMAFLLQRFRARLRFFPLWQQALAILVLLLNDRVISEAVHFAVGARPSPWIAWLAPVLGAALWPWLFLALDELRLRRRT
jgi:rod shape-determining protein MreD